MNADIFIICFLIFVAVAIFMIFYKFLFPYFSGNSKNDSLHASKRRKKSTKNDSKPSDKPRQTCPICNSILMPGENLQSRVFRTGHEDEICHIMGCPHCYPSCQTGVKRICPVCEKEIPCNGHLVARIFHHVGKADHVHVLGCNNCSRH